MILKVNNNTYIIYNTHQTHAYNIIMFSVKIMKINHSDT